MKKNHRPYQLIASKLESQREALSEPMKLEPEVKLADQMNVARDTVRRALHLLEQRGAVTRRPGRGTYLHPIRPTHDSCEGGTIGFIPPWWATSISESYTSTVFDGVSRWSEEHHCNNSILTVGHYDDDEHALLRKVMERKLKGLLWVHPVPGQLKLLKGIAKHVPCVVIGREYPESNLHTIIPDYEQAALLFDEHLVAAGHENYSVMGHDLMDPFGSAFHHGFTKAFEERNSRFVGQSHYVSVTPFARDMLPELFLDLHLPRVPETQALVLTSTSYLSPLLRSDRIREALSEWLSLVAFDYGMQPIETYWPGVSVSHVSCDWSKIGNHAMAMLFALVRGERDLPPIVREPVYWVDGKTLSLNKNSDVILKR